MCVPLSQQKVIRFDVGVYDVGLMQRLHHVQNTDGEVEDQRLWHHLLTATLVQVYCVLQVKHVTDAFKSSSTDYALH